MNYVRPSFIVNGDVIPESEKVKYLGHIICSDLNDDEDMVRQTMIKGMLFLEVSICVRSLYSHVYVSSEVALYRSELS